MPQIACLFCHHRNPVGSRYCNDCGSPMYLRGCPVCNTVDKREATHCYQCGAALPAPPAEEPDETPTLPQGPVGALPPVVHSVAAAPPNAQTRDARPSYVVLACGVLAFGALAAGLDYLGRRWTRVAAFEQGAPAVNVIADAPAPLRVDPPVSAPSTATSDLPAQAQPDLPRAEAAPSPAPSAKGRAPTAKGKRGTRRTPEANKRR